jgi:hypothetical protein
MTGPFYQYKLASGWNVAAGSLVNIESIKPTGDTYYFFAPKAYGFYDPGQRKVRGDGTILMVGFPLVTWEFDVITRLQHEYLIATYSTGGNTYSGKVTINTRLGTSTYVRYNAVMIIPKPIEADGATYAFRNYRVLFTRLAAAA